MRACVKSLLGLSENVVVSFASCPAVSDKPLAQVVPAASVHNVLALAVVDVSDDAVGADGGFAALKDHHNKRN